MSLSVKRVADDSSEEDHLCFVCVGRVAVVTGASSGIGAATAEQLAEDGFHVFLGARRFDRIEALAEKIGGTGLPLDVTDDRSVRGFCEQVPECALLVNNAGGALGLDPVAESDDERWRTMYETNVLGAVRMIRALLPKLVASADGQIITIGSISGREVYRGVAVTTPRSSRSTG